MRKSCRRLNSLALASADAGSEVIAAPPRKFVSRLLVSHLRAVPGKPKHKYYDITIERRKTTSAGFRLLWEGLGRRLKKQEPGAGLLPNALQHD
jgi:hypothetical protein